MKDPICPEAVRVIFHLNGGYTKVLLERLLPYENSMDIPTSIIPTHLRPLGSRFLITFVSYDADELVNAKIEEITDKNK